MTRTQRNLMTPSVLIVEDEARLRELLARAIPGMGFTAHAVRSAEEALKHVEAAGDAPDIVVLDLNLPGMGGMELFKALRASHPDVQVIILTGFGDLEAAKEAIRLEVADFLTKPCHLGELEQALARAHKRAFDKRPPVLPDLVWPADEDHDGPPKLEDVERQHILAALERHNGNRGATAAELGISLRTLYYRLNEYQKQGFRIE